MKFVFCQYTAEKRRDKISQFLDKNLSVKLLFDSTKTKPYQLNAKDFLNFSQDELNSAVLVVSIDHENNA